ncbi:nitrous oxide reductase accessory protein NosL [uncultured Desulfosarcina sp.]|uniref:nitrous oxide reductase accessory protein NosL n=1 Tax=uncultured Desulfosarcina sp. TaxID=218289 RepID=UPI0029C951A3|nr:nitrous oxide reductase accessory protein NosL [uncultured Desulfosarcina sp.]
MKSIPRRSFLKFLAFSTVSPSLLPAIANADDCKVQHPIMPPDSRYPGQCPVCGMSRPMWARTWITFSPVMGVSQACSFHCLADWALKSGQDPQRVMLTLYHQPEKSIPSEKAFIVMGSAAAGTMSPVSKIVFAARHEADAFAKTCGGTVVDYSRALLTAKVSVAQENQMINKRRIEEGKIVEPKQEDSCVVCKMVPAHYSYGKCQIQTKDGKTLHFCSTQCLFAFLGRQTAYIDAPITPLLVWVVDRTSGMWISGLTAFYVIGSSRVFGPMGHEAFPFALLENAKAFAVENGGKAVVYGDVTIDKIVPQWKYNTD